MLLGVCPNLLNVTPEIKCGNLTTFGSHLIWYQVYDTKLGLPPKKRLLYLLCCQAEHVSATPCYVVLEFVYLKHCLHAYIYMVGDMVGSAS